jgi:hypothetical protein
VVLLVRDAVKRLKKDLRSPERVGGAALGDFCSSVRAIFATPASLIYDQVDLVVVRYALLLV